MLEMQGQKGLEMFRGMNATCNECLAHRENWAAPEMVKELSYCRSTRLNTERK